MVRRDPSGSARVARNGFAVLFVAVALWAGALGARAAEEEPILSDADRLLGFDGPDGSGPSSTSAPATGGAERSTGSGSPTFPRVWCPEIADEVTREICWKSYRAGLAYYERGLAHRTDVFAWQHFSTQVIFVVVLVLVATGIFFAWVQFNRGDATDESELEIGPKGLKIRSPIIGLIILTLSLAFFYLYLVYVYPIQELI